MKIRGWLRNKILSTWYTREDDITEKIKNMQGISGSYLNIPFVVNGVPTNEARWNVKIERFDQITVPMWIGDDVIKVIIKI